LGGTYKASQPGKSTAWLDVTEEQLVQHIVGAGSLFVWNMNRATLSGFAKEAKIPPTAVGGCVQVLSTWKHSVEDL